MSGRADSTKGTGRGNEEGGRVALMHGSTWGGHQFSFYTTSTTLREKGRELCLRLHLVCNYRRRVTTVAALLLKEMEADIL